MSTSKQNYENSASQAINSEKVMHLPGSIINDRYQIIQKLGKSVTEKTYLAKDLQATADARCIVEQLSFEHENEANWRIIQQYLLNEVSVLNRLGDHPQIPQFYHHFVREQEFYFVREYIDGSDLEQEVKCNVFDEADTIFLLQDGLRILDFIHKTSVIHRDVQPIHLIRRKHDRAYVLINFGAIREIEATQINLQGELILKKSVGNWVYAAPEQREGESHFSSDIYALAKSAVYALTGKSPSELEQTNIDWRSQCQISSKLESIITKMMSPIIEQRYLSALGVLNDLRPLLKIGQSVGGRYLITSYLGGKEGTETYVADNLRRQYQSPCSIKQIELPHSENLDRIQLERNFAEELSVLERLGYHEQIPQLWDHFEEDDRFYLVREYIQGKNLAEKIAEQDLSVTQVVQILDSTLSVLEFIHQNRIIHRNIKPSNLLIRETDWQVIVTDFSVLSDIKALSNTVGDSQGSQKQNYWSPEQTAGRPTISSDLYALGMTTIEALTGHKPATFVREESGKLLWSKNLNLDRRLIRVIDKLIQLDLGQRYQSAFKARNDLRKINNYGDLNPSPSNIQLPNTKNYSTKRSLLNAVAARAFARQSSHDTALYGTFVPSSPSETGEPKALVLPLSGASAKHSLSEALRTKGLPACDPQQRLEPHVRAASPLPLLIGLLGIFCLFGSIEFAFPTVRPTYYSHRGEKLLPEQPQTALNNFTKAIDLKAKSWRGWSGRGDSLFILERYPQALDAYTEATKLNPENAVYWSKQGDVLFRLEKFTEAISAYNQALELDSENADVYHKKGQALAQLQQYEAALVMQDAALEQDRLNPQFLSDRAENLFQLGRYEEALGVFNRVQAIEPDNLKLWQNKFLVLEALDRPQEADRLSREINNKYIQLIQQQPQNVKAWIAQGNFFTTAQMYTKSIEAYDQAISLNSESYEAWLGKGQALIKQGKLELAKTALDRALQQRSTSHLALQFKGRINLQQGNFTQAIALYDRAIEISPNNAALWLDRGIADSQQGRYTQAISSLTQASELSPYNLTTWQELISAWLALGKDEKAIDTLNRALKYYPQNPELWGQLGLVHTRNGQYNEACEIYRRASRATAKESAVIMSSMKQLGCRQN